MEFLSSFFDSLSAKYIVSVILFTYFIIGLWFNTKSEKTKKLITFIVGVTFGVLWYFLFDISLEDMIPSFAAAVVLYDYILKYFLKLLKISYDKLSKQSGKLSNKEEE